MKNKTLLIFVLCILIALVLGCSKLSPFSSKETNIAKSNTANPANKEKTTGENTDDPVIGDEKIGVPECDELFEALTKETESKDEGYVAKATREYFYNKIRESIKKSIEENKNDKTKLAKECRDYKAQIDKHKAEEEKNKE